MEDATPIMGGWGGAVTGKGWKRSTDEFEYDDWGISLNAVMTFL